MAETEPKMLESIYLKAKICGRFKGTQKYLINKKCFTYKMDVLIYYEF